MIVVADTSPLRYLVLIQQSDVLPMLYGRVVVPPAVLESLPTSIVQRLLAIDAARRTQ